MPISPVTSNTIQFWLDGFVDHGLEKGTTDIGGTMQFWLNGMPGTPVFPVVVTTGNAINYFDPGSVFSVIMLT